MKFSVIDIDKCLPYKDFGRGFYMTDILTQAERMAQRKSNRFGEPIVLTYEVDDAVIRGEDDCKVKVFEKVEEEWAEFVLSNRERRVPPFQHDYDIVIGPVADDGIAFILNRYQEGAYTLAEAMRALQFKKLSSQYCFCTERAITHLKLHEQ